MMDCREVRNVLWPADVLRIGDDEVQAAIEHAEDCQTCRDFLEEDRRVAKFIRDNVPRVRAPRELRERLYTALARERAGTAPRQRWPRSKRGVVLLATVIAGVAMASGYWVVSRSQPATAATAFAEDYLRRVVEQEELSSSDGSEIASFFARELGVAMPPPQIPDLEIQRASICLMNGRRGGVVEYAGGGTHLTYYLLPGAGNPVTGPRTLVSRRQTGASSASPAVAEERGLGVATWWDDEHQHALVGSLSERELKRLTPLFACPATRSLAGP